MKPKHNLVMAIASKGGHWEQLMLLRPAFEGQEILYGTTDGSLPIRDGLSNAAILPDAHRDNLLHALRCGVAAITLVFRKQPRILISTGALPGLICLAAARVIGARTIWIDSFANSERLSMSGRVACHIAHQVFTQWPHLAETDRVYYHGSIL